jgi:hypothetical protein
MIKKMYSIYDVKAKFFIPPFPAHNDEDCKRAVMSALQTPQSPYAQHPQDYRLFGIGQFDDNAGQFVPYEQPEFICECTELVASVPGEAQDNENIKLSE